MIKIAYEGSVKQWFGKPLSKLSVKLPDGTVTNRHGIKVLKTAGTYDGYEENEAGYQEILSKGEVPDHMEIVRWRNARALAAEKGKENAKVVKDAGFVEPTAENDPSILLNTFYTAFIAVVRMDPEWKAKPEAEQVAEARRRASEQSGLDWPSDEEE